MTKEEQDLREMIQEMKEAKKKEVWFALPKAYRHALLAHRTRELLEHIDRVIQGANPYRRSCDE